jgi:hypothetical protein
VSDQNDYQSWNISCTFYSNSGGGAVLMVQNCPDIAFPELTDAVALALAEGFKAAWPEALQSQVQCTVQRTHTVLVPVSADLTATPPAFPS